VSQAGITVVVAGGNGNTDACSVTPAAGPGVIAVGNLDSTDNRGPQSNFGYPSPPYIPAVLSLSLGFFPLIHMPTITVSDCIDIWAPGTGIVSTSAFGSNTATAIMTGTSMACPHVAGIISGLKTRMELANTINYLFVRSQVHCALPQICSLFGNNIP
jgi:subtilisin family serine protease